jgi:hypothetical protein
VRPYTGDVGKNFILMDDNAPPHRAHIVRDYLEQESIQRMDWSARSPDLNPIELACLGQASRQSVGTCPCNLGGYWK